MTVSKPHHFIAGIADVYFISYVYGAVLAIISIITRRKIPIFVSIFGYPFMIFALVFYYRKISKNTIKLSPGERFAGRFVEGANKAWMNPYGKNRFFFYFCMFLFLGFFGNIWDGISLRILGISEWFSGCASLLILSIGTVKAGHNSKNWIIYINGVLFLNLILAFFPFSYPKEFPRHYPSLEEIAMITKVSFIFLLAVANLNFFIYVLFNKKLGKYQNPSLDTNGDSVAA